MLFWVLGRGCRRGEECLLITVSLKESRFLPFTAFPLPSLPLAVLEIKLKFQG